jgi:hypothetical protein
MNLGLGSQACRTLFSEVRRKQRAPISTVCQSPSPTPDQTIVGLANRTFMQEKNERNSEFLLKAVPVH